MDELELTLHILRKLEVIDEYFYNHPHWKVRLQCLLQENCELEKVSRYENDSNPIVRETYLSKVQQKNKVPKHYSKMTMDDFVAIVKQNNIKTQSQYFAFRAERQLAGELLPSNPNKTFPAFSWYDVK